MSRSRRWLRVAVPIVVTAALLFLLLRAVRPAELLETLAEVSPGFVLLAGALLGGGVALALLIALGLTALFWHQPRGIIVSWLERLALPPSIHDRLHAAIEELGSGSRPALLVAATVAARVATGLQYFALFAAIDQPLSLVQVWFALSIRTLLLAVPTQGLGGFGTTQVWWTAGLTLLGWSVDDAIAASLAVHLLDLTVSLPQAALGWLAVSLSASAEEKEQARLVGAQRR